MGKNPHYIHVVGSRWSSADVLLLTEAEEDGQSEVLSVVLSAVLLQSAVAPPPFVLSFFSCQVHGWFERVGPVRFCMRLVRPGLVPVEPRPRLQLAVRPIRWLLFLKESVFVVIFNCFDKNWLFKLLCFVGKSNLFIL